MRPITAGRARAMAAAVIASVVAACDSGATGPLTESRCPTTAPPVLAPGISLSPQAVRMTLDDLAGRVAPSFGGEGAALGGKLSALAAVWPARTEDTCTLYDEARAALGRVSATPAIAPDRALVAFFLDAVGSLLASDS